MQGAWRESTLPEEGETGSLGAPHSEEVSGARPQKTARKKTQAQILNNRRIQTRYRAKQKEKNERLFSDHEAACRDLERAKGERASLVWNNSLLEAVLATREEHIQALEAVRGDVSCTAPKSFLRELLEPRLRRQRQPASSLRGRVDWEEVGSVADPATAQPPAATSMSTESANLASGDSVEVAGAAAPATVGPLGSAIEDSLVDPWEAAASELGDTILASLQRRKNSSEKFDSMEALRSMEVSLSVVERVKTSTPDKLFRSWEQHLRMVSDLLTQYEMTRSESVMAELKLRMDKWAVLIAVVLVHNPILLQHFMAANLGPELPEAEEQQKWDELVVALDLSAAERAAYLRVGSAYEAQVGKLRARKQQALQLIREGSLDVEQLDAAGLSNMMAHYLRVWEGASTLAAYPDLEFVLSLQLTGEMNKLWSEVQRARVLVCAGPNFPDCLKLIEAVRRAVRAVEDGDKSKCSSSVAPAEHRHVWSGQAI